MAPTMGGTGLTCRKCALNFSSRKEAKEHYGTEWHSINVKRVMQGQKSLTQSEFDTSRKQSSYVTEGKRPTFTLSCKTCDKHFLSQGSHDTHMRSRKHKDGIRKRAAEQYRKMKEEREAKKIAESSNPNYVEEESDEETDETKTAQHCTTCDQTFASKRDFGRHLATDKHKTMVAKYRMEHDRRAELDRLDDESCTKAITMGEEEWEDTGSDDDVDMDDDSSQTGEAPMEFIENDVAIPSIRCIFCPKAFLNIPDNVGHMERQHNLVIPHKKSADMEKLLSYIGKKVGEHHLCMDCSRPFNSLRGVRTHMLSKPHHEIRFEGEYDGFFDIEKIVAPLGHIPLQAAADHCFALPLADGSLLTHRDLKRYFKQRLSEKVAMKRLKSANSGAPALSHLGKLNPRATTAVEIRKAQKVQRKGLSIITRVQKRQRLAVNVKANKLQPHLRPQVINAG